MLWRSSSWLVLPGPPATAAAARIVIVSLLCLLSWPSPSSAFLLTTSSPSSPAATAASCHRAQPQRLQPPTPPSTLAGTTAAAVRRRRTRRRNLAGGPLWSAPSGDEEEEGMIAFGDGAEELPDEIWDEVERGRPSEWTVMKDILGINVFTYILAALIAFFLGANLLLGPGWLGSLVGVQGAGQFTEISDSIPDAINLGDGVNDAEYLIQ